MRWVEVLAGGMSRRSRERKLGQFLRLVAPRECESILDVGVADEEFSENDNFLEKHYGHPENIVAVAHKSLERFSERHPDIRVVVADGRALPFDDDEFPIAYSNAVIEHTGSRADQLTFLRELHRVGRRGYVTTPNRHFPIEVHTRTPLLHLLLPKRWFDGFLRLIGKKWATGDYMNLLSRRDLTKLLAEAGIRDGRVVRSRTFGLTLTLAVVWSKESRAPSPGGE